MTRLRWTIAAAAISLEWLVGPQLHPALLALSLALLLTIGIGHGGLDRQL